MLKIFKDYLFSKNIFVSEGECKCPFETCFSLAKLFDIRITEGSELANEDMIRQAEALIGRYVPYAFYQGFPDSVRELSEAQLIYDQLVHYTVTYGFGCVDAPGRSLFEKDFQRIAFKEETEPKSFIILTEEAAVKCLGEYIEGMLASSRPLNESQMEVLECFIEMYSYQIKSCACKDTAIELLVRYRDIYYARFISLSDAIKVLDKINYREYDNYDLRKLNLKNKDRKFITKLLSCLFESGRCDERECFEKKAIWAGLLHHIHYKPTCEAAVQFLALMRGEKNGSVYSEFERKMSEGKIADAARILREGKGAGAVLRNLNYMVSRCDSDEEISSVLEYIDTKNAVILIQLLMQYGAYNAEAERCFRFVRYRLMTKHTETEEEKAKRRSVLTNEQVSKLNGVIREKLCAILSGKLGKVYIDSEMQKMAIPLQESTSNGGYGVLAKGSCIPLEQGKKIRAFTYWEKVDDIDLSVIGIDESGKQSEFSWRTMYRNQTKGISYSGDQTSGYSGGSEYFDIDPVAFKKEHSDIRYLVFCNNVFSFLNFNRCVCRAGYMLRDRKDSGEIFEPKTVKTAFDVEGESTFSYLFGIDLEKNEFVWLNINRELSVRVAGATDVGFLIPYFSFVDTLSLADIFRMMATEVVDDPELADTVLSNGNVTLKEGAEQIRSFDFEKISALLG